jgi:hypothetical protein
MIKPGKVNIMKKTVLFGVLIFSIFLFGCEMEEASQSQLDAETDIIIAEETEDMVGQAARLRAELDITGCQETDAGVTVTYSYKGRDSERTFENGIEGTAFVGYKCEGKKFEKYTSSAFTSCTWCIDTDGGRDYSAKGSVSIEPAISERIEKLNPPSNIELYIIFGPPHATARLTIDGDRKEVTEEQTYTFISRTIFINHISEGIMGAGNLDMTTTQLHDFCSGDVLAERFCRKADGQNVLVSLQYTCPNGCQEGACV